MVGAKVLHHKPSSVRVLYGIDCHGASLFITRWNLCTDSRLFVRANALEFPCHVFPPATVSDMDTMDGFALL